MKKTALLLPVALLLTSLPCAAQGPLTPPGAQGETMYTLEEIYQKLLSNEQLLAEIQDDLAAAGIPPPDTLQQGLIAYFPFEGNANDPGAGIVNDGSLNGPVLTTGRLGFAESAYRFDGVDDSIEWSEAVSDFVV